MKRLTIIIMALVLAIGMVQCKKKVEPMMPCGGSVYVTLTAGCGTGAKTTITNSGMVYWSEGDKLYVVGSEDGYLGELTTMNYTDTDPSSIVTFGGTIREMSTTQDLHFYYPGRAGISVSRSTLEYTFDISTQDGTLDGIANTMHLMHGVKTDIEPGTTAFGEVNMANMMAIARLDLSGYDAPVKCTAISSRTLDLRTGEWSGSGSTGNITLNHPTDAYYMALIPGNQMLTFRQNGSDSNPVVKNWLVQAGKLYTDNGASIVIAGGTPVLPVETDDWINFNDQPGEDFGVSGLPLWSKKNLGATCSTDFPANPLAATTWIGDYYAWGEVEPYAAHITWSYGDYDVTWCDYPEHNPEFTFDESGYSIFNYVSGNYDDGGYPLEWDPAPYGSDYQLRFDLPDRGDAARAKLGGSWRMPSMLDMMNVVQSVFVVPVIGYRDIPLLNGFAIYKVKNVADKGEMSLSGEAPSGETYSIDDDPHMFIPVAGYFNGTYCNVFDLTYGHYWLSSLYLEDPYDAYTVNFTLNYDDDDPASGEIASFDFGFGRDFRYIGNTIRPVTDNFSDPTLFDSNAGDFTPETW